MTNFVPKREPSPPYIILNSFTHGLEFESVKPIDFSDEVDLQVRARFRGLGGKLQKRSK